MGNKLYIAFWVVGVFFLSWSSGWALCAKRESLFKIERSKNKNIVQYNACLLQDNKISDETPVEVYWILANGQKEELSLVESKEAYGIGSKEKLAENKYRILLAVLKDRNIVVQKVKGDYKAIVQINGESSILERVYIRAEEKNFGLPQVDYVDLFGQSLRTNQPVKERIIPDDRGRVAQSTLLYFLLQNMRHSQK